jgi:CheY-like chemotaxis protein
MAFRKKRILLVDDNKTTVMYVSLLLKRMGFEIIPAENGMEALKLLSVSEPDLIMLDLAMPVLDGLETLKRIRMDYTMQSLPVVVVTIDPTQAKVDECMKMGCSGILAKPVRLDELHEILQDCIFAPMGIKRKHLRSHYDGKVQIRVGDRTEQLQGETLSEGGVYLRKVEPYPAGTEMDIVLPLDQNRLLRTRGTVIYAKDRFGDLFKAALGMAVEFHGLSDDDAQHLKNHISTLLTRDILGSQEEPVIALEKDTAAVED